MKSPSGVVMEYLAANALARKAEKIIGDNTVRILKVEKRWWQLI